MAAAEGTLLKCGGSLLNHPDLPRQLTELVSGFSCPILLVGGGAAADVVRDWDRIFQLGEVRSHELAMKSLQLTANLLVELIPHARLCCSLNQIAGLVSQNFLPVLDPVACVNELQQRSSLPFPKNWEMTTDSIGLWIAAAAGLQNYVLIKSVSRPQEWSWDSLSTSGLVDAEFPRTMSRLTSPPEISWINLRTESCVR